MLIIECPSCDRETAVEPELVELLCAECGALEKIAPE